MPVEAPHPINIRTVSGCPFNAGSLSCGADQDSVVQFYNRGINQSSGTIQGSCCGSRKDCCRQNSYVQPYPQSKCGQLTNRLSEPTACVFRSIQGHTQPRLGANLHVCPYSKLHAFGGRYRRGAKIANRIPQEVQGRCLQY